MPGASKKQIKWLPLHPESPQQQKNAEKCSGAKNKFQPIKNTKPCMDYWEDGIIYMHAPFY